MNCYFLLNLNAGAANRLNTAQGALAANGSNRRLPHEVGHIRMRSDGRAAIIQAELTDAERIALLTNAWVSLLGLYDPTTRRADQAVYTFLQTNRAEWEQGLSV